jgi:TetR/AcrR family transcriptional repressor of nem operon
MGRTSDARERLVGEAARLFHERSYESVGVQELCEAAEINKGSFYHFFPSKEDLAGAVIDEQKAAVVREVLDPGLADDLAPLARLERMFGLMAKAQRRARREKGFTPGCPIVNLSGELCTHEPKLRRKLARVYAEIRKRVETTLREAVLAGELPRTANVASLAEAVVALSEGSMILSAVHDDPATAARVGRFVRALAAA